MKNWAFALLVTTGIGVISWLSITAIDLKIDLVALTARVERLEKAQRQFENNQFSLMMEIINDRVFAKFMRTKK